MAVAHAAWGNLPAAGLGNEHVVNPVPKPFVVLRHDARVIVTAADSKVRLAEFYREGARFKMALAREHRETPRAIFVPVTCRQFGR